MGSFCLGQCWHSPSHSCLQLAMLWPLLLSGSWMSPCPQLKSRATGQRVSEQNSLIITNTVVPLAQKFSFFWNAADFGQCQFKSVWAGYLVCSAGNGMGDPHCQSRFCLSQTANTRRKVGGTHGCKRDQAEALSSLYFVCCVFWLTDSICLGSMYVRTYFSGGAVWGLEVLQHVAQCIPLGCEWFLICLGQAGVGSSDEGSREPSSPQWGACVDQGLVTLGWLCYHSAQWKITINLGCIIRLCKN